MRGGLINRGQAMAFLIGSMLMLPIVFGRDWVAGNDSYYHMAMARYPLGLAFADTFPWLHWTLFREQFVNHHLGFQCLLYPLVLLSDVLTGDLVPGGQAALLLASGTTALCFYRILVLRGVPFPLAWTVLLGLLPWHYWLRHAYVRAPIIAMPMMLVAVELFMRRKVAGLAAWGVVFMLVYFGAVLYAVLVGGLLAGLFLGGGAGWRYTVRAGLLVAAGLAVGFAVHPSFPENIPFMMVQVFDSGLSAASDIGNEWRPPDAWFAAKMWLPLFLVWITCLLLALRRGARLDGDGMALVILGFVFLILSAKMRRFVEYAPVFVLLSAADLYRASSIRIPGMTGRIKAALAFLLVMASATGPWQTRMQTSPPFPLADISRAMDWLKNNTVQGSMVLADDWDDFPAFFYFNRHNRFAVGLDPMFTARPYPHHWNIYKQITRGQGDLEDVRGMFLADYLLVRDDHGSLWRQAIGDARFEVVYPHGEGPFATPPPVTVFKVPAGGM